MTERSLVPRRFFSNDEIKHISEAISLAERNTQGEIRVHIERKTDGDVLERAPAVLKDLGLTETKNHTGLLIYISLEDHRFAIIGDEGIHRVLGQDGWNALSKELGEYFKRGKFAEGLVAIIGKVGEILAQAFPALPENVNEIPNEPTYGNE
jgi:uncharacterized membrane protein